MSANLPAEMPAEMPAEVRAELPVGRPTPGWAIFLVFAWGYVLSYALRVVNAVIGPGMMQELGLSSTELGLISAAYFITFAAMQLPLGVWLDRFGARKTEAALLLLAAGGCLLFASASSLPGLWLGRALIGVGVSACLMASFKAFRRWFPARQQSQLGSAMFVAGTIGALSATIPASAALPLLGWRGLFYAMALFLLSAALLLWWILPAEPVSDAGSTNQPGYRQIFADRYFRRLALIGLVNQSFFMATQSLWAGLWLHQVSQLDKATTADVLFGFNLCMLAGYLGLIWLAPRFIILDGHAAHGWRRFRLSHVISVGLALALLLQLALVASHSPYAWLLWPVYALFATTGSLAQSHIGLAFPAAIAGRANTAFNLLLFVGAFVFQSGIGLLVDALQSGGQALAGAMRLALLAATVLQALSLLGFVLARAQVSHNE